MQGVVRYRRDMVVPELLRTLTLLVDCTSRPFIRTYEELQQQYHCFLVDLLGPRRTGGEPHYPTPNEG